jgi:hypothetical protein
MTKMLLTKALLCPYSNIKKTLKEKYTKKINLAIKLPIKIDHAMKKCNPKNTLTQECNVVWSDIENYIDEIITTEHQIIYLEKKLKESEIGLY